jgi:hypothetical protein
MQIKMSSDSVHISVQLFALQHLSKNNKREHKWFQCDLVKMSGGNDFDLYCPSLCFETRIELNQSYQK